MDMQELKKKKKEYKRKSWGIKFPSQRAFKVAACIYVLIRLGFNDKTVLFMFVFRVNPLLLTSNVFAPVCVIFSSKLKNRIWTLLCCNNTAIKHMPRQLFTFTVNECSAQKELINRWGLFFFSMGFDLDFSVKNCPSELTATDEEIFSKIIHCVQKLLTGCAGSIWRPPLNPSAGVQRVLESKKTAENDHLLLRFGEEKVKKKKKMEGLALCS